MVVLHKVEGLVGGVLVCGLIWAGCGEPAPPSNGTTFTLEEYFAKTAEAHCTKAFDCCEMTELVDELGFDPPPATAEACFEQLFAIYTEQLGPTKADVAAGRLTYSPDHAEACIAKIKAASCIDYYVNRITGTDPDCHGAIDPGVALGGACNDHNECKDEGAICVAVDFGSPKTCVIRPGVGEPCAGGNCAKALYCKIETDLCTAPGPVGAACDRSEDCQSEFCSVGACVAPLPTGAGCVNGGGCGPEGYCDFTTSTCAAKKPDGAACESFGECMSPSCSDKTCGYSIPATICDGL